MKDSAPIIHRSLKRERDKYLPGTVISFTKLMHPPALFGNTPRTIGLIELEDGRQVLSTLLSESPYIGEKVYPRMRLSHVTTENLRVYVIAFESYIKQKIYRGEFPGYILALTGPSGVGKSTLSRMLTSACAEYTQKVPILTTRAPKSGDDDEYVYVTTKEFERLKENGAIVAETNIPSAQENRRYGYRNTDIQKIWAAGKIPVVITEMHLLEDLSEHYGRRSILSCGVLPPGKSRRAKISQLLHRLRSRGRETEEHIQHRIKNAKEDLAFFSKRSDLFDHMVVNAKLSTTIALLKKKVLKIATV